MTAASFLPLDIPPGFVRNGTDYSSKGRWLDGSLWRWKEGQARPIGGWVQFAADAVTGAPRCVIQWRDNNGGLWIAVGTHSGLFAINRAGQIYVLTPAGFTAGRVSAMGGAGFGGALFGAGPFGTPRQESGVSQDATVWSLDTYGPYLVGVSPDDQRLYSWDFGSDPAAPIANAPTATALVVTADHMILALATNGDPRQVSWCDQANDTIWTASNTNTAGSIDLQTNGRLMCGRVFQAGTLLWTDADLWLVTLQQSQLIYGFTKVGLGCGVVSRGAAVALLSQAVWMGSEGFYAYDGASVSPLACDVSDHVFGDLNVAQASKVTAFHNSLFNEVWWFYPSAESSECDSYVAYNYKDSIWLVGKLGRTCACDKSVLAYPIMVNPIGFVFEHEDGLNWDGALPYATSAPLEVADGDAVARIQGMIPDEATLGQVQASIVGRFYPDGPSTSFGPFNPAAKTDFRLTARQVQVTYAAVGQADFRVGKPRLIVKTGGVR